MSTRIRKYASGTITYRAIIKPNPVVPKEIVLGEYPTREEASRAVKEYRQRKKIPTYHITPIGLRIL